jgi:UDP-3-O-[3-hydroxymyristoyl] glucosamine N-acyltransferase
MSDPRFFKNSGPFDLVEISSLIEGELSGNDNQNISIADISSLKLATGNEVTFFQDISYKADLSETNAGACIIKKEHKAYAPENIRLIYSKNPYIDFTKISQLFYPDEILPKNTT